MSDLDLTHYPIDLDDLPSGWRHGTVRDAVADAQSGFASGKHNRDGVGVLHLRPMNVTAYGEVSLDDTRSVDPSADEKRISEGEVLFNNTNSPALVGKTALVREGPPRAFSNHMTRLVPSLETDARFLAIQLHYLYAAGYYRHQCKKHVNQASIATSFLLDSIPFVSPPLAEQRRLANTIEGARARSRRAKTALDAASALLDRLHQSILAAAFRGDLTADWREQNPDIEPASELLKRIRVERRTRWEEGELAKMLAKGKPPKDERWKSKYVEPTPVDDADLPELPDGWCWASLAEFAWDAGYGTSEKCDYEFAGPAVLRIPNVAAGRVSYDNLKFARASEAIAADEQISPGDLLIVRTNGSRDLLGRGAVVLDRPDHVTSFASYLIRFRLVPGLAEWIDLMWSSPHVRRYVDQHAASSAGQHNISLTTLAKTPLPLPPSQEFAMASKVARAALGRLSGVTQRAAELNGSLRALDTAVLGAAFRGELT